MSYINNVTGYRKDILETRSEVHKGAWALIEPDGIVKNVIPGFVDCDTTILGSPPSRGVVRRLRRDRPRRRWL